MLRGSRNFNSCQTYGGLSKRIFDKFSSGRREGLEEEAKYLRYLGLPLLKEENR